MTRVQEVSGGRLIWYWPVTITTALKLGLRRLSRRFGIPQQHGQGRDTHRVEKDDPELRRVRHSNGATCADCSRGNWGRSSCGDGFRVLPGLEDIAEEGGTPHGIDKERDIGAFR